MSFTRARLPGFWTFGSAVQPAEFEHIDDYAYAIDSRGGTYAPASVITIGGDGLTVSGPLIATDADTIDVTGALTILGGSTLSVSGNVSMNSGAIALWLSGSFLTVQNGATFTLGSTVPIATGSRSYQRAEMFLQYNDFTYWAQNPLYVRSFPAVSSQLLASGVAFQIDNQVWEARVPDAATLNTVSWTISPTAGHGALPTLPKFWVEVIDVTTGAATHSTSVTDPSGSVVAYEATHTITSGALGWVIDKTKHVILVRCQGEGGAAFIAGMLANMPVMTFTRTKLAEE